MKRILITKAGWFALTAVLACLTVMSGAVSAAPTIQWTGENFPFSISADGTVVVGNDNSGNFETFRWTALTGPILLGRNTSVSGAGAGIPKVSDDGNHVSATICTPDSLYATQGIWTKGVGWEIAMPPTPPTGGPSANSYGSAWGISGDGSTVTGLYWRYGQPDTLGSAHANSWNRNTGTFIPMQTPVRNCRGNGLNYDGSIVAGWSEKPFGTWQPTIWEDGIPTVLTDTDHFTEAKGISNDGDTVWGNTHDPLTDQISATIWKRDGSGWQESILGVLPGTFIGYGQAFVLDMAEVGNIAVGYNEYTWGSGTGFVWTLNEGMVSAMDFFTSHGLTFPANFQIDNLTGISHDGKHITGFGHDTTIFPAIPQGFVVSLDYVSDVPDIAGGKGMSFEPNYPNPFNPTTTIALSLERAQNVRLNIFDAQGRLVRTLHDGALAAGRNEMKWDGRDDRGLQAASGIYFSRAQGEDGSVKSDRMMLVK